MVGGGDDKVMEPPLATPQTVGFVLAALGYLPQLHPLLSPPHEQPKPKFSGPGVFGRSQCLGELVLEVTWLSKSPEPNCI